MNKISNTRRKRNPAILCTHKKIQLTERKYRNTQKIHRTATSLNEKYFTFFVKKSCIQLLGAERRQSHHDPLRGGGEQLHHGAAAALAEAQKGIGGGMPPALEEMAEDADGRAAAGGSLHGCAAAAPPGAAARGALSAGEVAQR